MSNERETLTVYVYQTIDRGRRKIFLSDKRHLNWKEKIFVLSKED
jgi:hypothetical protein